MGEDVKFRLIAALGLAFSGGAVALATPAHADECGTYVTRNVVRPDSGTHGVWATDTFNRTVRICSVATIATNSYRATFTDHGTFATLPNAKSPGEGDAVDLKDTIVGIFEGGATYDFVTSEPLDLHALRAYTPADSDYPSTSEWMSKWLGSFEKGGYAEGGKAWGWTYRTRCEKWVNSGTGNTGNIVGKVCRVKPKPPWTHPTEPTSTATPTESETTDAGTDGDNAAGTDGGDDNAGGTLPVTGTSVAGIAGFGLALIGVGALLLARRGREFEA